jgi:hypothetical protein
MMLQAPPYPRRLRDRRQRATAAQSRYRARLKANEVIAPVVVTLEIIELLLTLGWLSMDVSEDHRQIGAAITALLRDAAKHR